MRYHQKSNNSSLLGVFSILTSLIAGSFVVGLATSANAQQPTVPSPPGTAPTAPAYTSNFSGSVERYLLNPSGEVDGLLLSNGLEVKFPPHMATSLTATVQPGDRVKVTGIPGVPSSFGQEIRAYSITNTQTEKTVVDQPPAAPPQPPVVNRYENLTAEGTAKRWLVGPQGEINGIVLSSGAQVKFPPHIGYELTNLARRGAKIQAQGFGSRSSYGSVLEATSLAVDGQTISLQAPVSNRPLPRPR